MIPASTRGLALLLTLAAGLPVHATSYHAILCGAGGEARYQEQFREWGLGLRTALTETLGIAPRRVHLLMEKLPQADVPLPPGAIPTTLESIQQLFDDLAQSVSNEDDLYLYIIGHGSYLKRISKLHLPGPDISAETFGTLLDRIPARRHIILNSTASSAGFINILSGPNRVICTATKSVDEFNATEYMEYFIEGLREGAADRNYDERITFLEACEYAAEITATWYRGEGLIATEHAILDDNGDGLGSRLPIADAVEDLFPEDLKEANLALFDGNLASRCFLKDLIFPPTVPESLVTAYLAALDEAAVLKKQKPVMDPDTYYTQLETIMLRAARTNREIHTLTAAADTQPEL